MPDGVDVRKVDLSIELQILAFHEQRKAGAPCPTLPAELDERLARPGGDRMSVLVVGVSHRTAPVALLERARARRRRRRPS